MKKKVLVTGISGFVGQHCALELLKQSYQVKGSVRNRSKEVEVREGIAKFIDPKNQLEFYELDLTKDEGWEEAMSDVRDVAKLHVQALTKEGINGKRFIAARKQTTHFLEIAGILKENGYKKASTKKAPLFLLKLIGLFDPEVSALLTSVGKHLTVDISDTEATFDWEPIALEKSVLDMAQSVERALSQNK